MQKIKITADSTCDLSAALCERFDISLSPLTVVMGGNAYLDGVDITPPDIFEFVAKNGSLPKTSAVPAAMYEEFFAEQLKNYDCVIHISLSSKISSTYNNAVFAAKTFGGKVFVVDSLSLCAGQGILAIKASVLAKENRPPEEIVDTLDHYKENLNTSFIPDSLDYLHKGGRCNLASMISATLLKLHPFIDMKDGQMYAKKKYMGNMEVCIKKYVSDLAELYPDYDKSLCVIANAYAPNEIVKKLRAQIEETFAFETILETTAGCTITSHCGKNTVAVFFITE